MRVPAVLLCALGVSLAAAAADDWKQTTITSLKKDGITIYTANCAAKTEEPKLMKADAKNIKEAYVRPTGGCVRIVLADGRTVYVSETVVEHTLKKEAAACPPIVTAERDRNDNVSMGLGDGKDCPNTKPK